jgi:phenylpyruvate tautomerase PptA (4-oxalocrotonate tautomerase family)
VPIVRIDLPFGYPEDYKERLRQSAKAAVIDVLAPPDARYVYVGVCDVFARVGDGVPTVTVDLRPGREADQAPALASALADSVASVAGIAHEHIYVLFRVSEAANHYCGGEPLPEWT